MQRKLHRGTIWIVVLTFVLHAGCAPRFAVPPAEDLRAGFGRVGLVMAGFDPDVQILTPAKGAREGVGRGAGWGAARVGREFAQGCGTGDPYAGLVCYLLMVPAMVVGAAVGGVVGGAKAQPEEVIIAAEAEIQKAIADLGITDRFRDELLKTAQEEANATLVPVVGAGPVTPEQKLEYRECRSQHVDTVLEVSVLSFGLQDGKLEVNPALGLFFTVRGRLVRVADGEELHETTVSYRTPRGTFAQWAENDASRLSAAMEDAYDVLSREIVEEIFLVHQLRQADEGPFIRRQGLRAEYPPSGKEIETLRPTLRWEAFPRPIDLEEGRQEPLEGVGEVIYEIKVWREDNGEPGEVVYERKGLPASSHTLEVSLEPATGYFWSARAWFTYRGKRRVTAWGSYLAAKLPVKIVPSRYLYRFKTPPDASLSQPN